MSTGAIVYAVLFIGGFLGWSFFLRPRFQEWQRGRAEAPPGKKRDEESFALLEGPPRDALLALERDDVGPATQVLASLRGRWAERAFVLRCFAGTLERAPLDAAITASPNDAVLHLLRAQQAMEWAWRARGGGGAGTVSDEGWRRFRERMTMAERDLLRAVELDPADPIPHTRLVEIARHLSRGDAAALQHLNDALARDPADYAARSTYFTFFCQRRYQGSYEKMRAFAEASAADAPIGDLRHTFLLRTHWEMWSYELAFGDPATGAAYARRPEVRAEVAESYARSVGAPSHPRTGASLGPLNEFAAWFFLVEDRERARDALEKLGDEQYTAWAWSPLGPPAKQFSIARAWALENGPHRILGWPK